jgi:hypothetical protein
MMNLALGNVFVHTSQMTVLHVIKSYNMGPLALLPPPNPKEGMLWIFITLKNS